MPEEPNLEQALAMEAAGSQLATADDETAIYTSHPVANFSLGKYKFHKGTLKLNAEDAADFQKLLESLPLNERNKIQKIDIAAAERLVRARLDAQGGATKQTDSSTGERGKPVVGTGELGDTGVEAFANQAQMDMNRPVDQEKMDEPLAGTETSLPSGLAKLAFNGKKAD